MKKGGDKLPWQKSGGVYLIESTRRKYVDPYTGSLQGKVNWEGRRKISELIDKKIRMPQ
jgi:hypothetical protein